MALVAIFGARYTVTVIPAAQQETNALAWAQRAPGSVAPGLVPIVAVTVADLAPGADDWCQALAGEGLAVELDPGEPRVPDSPPQAAVLWCDRRLTEHLALLRELRQSNGNLPLVAVARELRELDQVLALEMGADDVIDAAVSAPLVAARLRALWRRARARASAEVDRLTFGRLSLHLRERRVQLGHEYVDLTECEFEVLWLLAEQAGRAVSRAEMLERLRGLPYQRIDRSIDSRVCRLRAKLRDGDGANQHIRTVRNCGYMFSPARW